MQSDNEVHKPGPGEEAEESQQALSELTPFEESPSDLTECCEAFSFQHEFVCLVDDISDEEEDDKDCDINHLDAFDINMKFSKPVQDVKKTCVENGYEDQGTNVIIENDKKFISEVLSYSGIELDTATEKSESNSYFEILPRELVLKIFSYFSQIELCRSVLPVCKRWYDIGYDSTLWTELDLSHCPDLPSVELCRAIKRATHLKKLVLTGRYGRPALAEVAIFTEYSNWLQHVDLGFCDIINTEVLAYFVKNCPNLEKLNVEGCHQVDDETVKLLVKAKNLKHFNFSHCALQDSGIEMLAKSMDKVMSLNVDGISWISDQSVQTLIDHQSDQLEWLELDGAELTNASIRCMANCPHLRGLQISFCETFTDQSLWVIKDFGSLTHLKLRKGFNFSNNGLRELFTSPNMSNLKFLDLSECTRLLDDGLISITKCCGRSLEVLAVCWCWDITDKGIISVVDHCSCLKTLDIVGLDKITGECFHRIPDEMRLLTLLDLKQCNRIIDDLIVEVIRRKPDLTVFNYYGEKFIHN